AELAHVAVGELAAVEHEDDAVVDVPPIARSIAAPVEEAGHPEVHEHRRRAGLGDQPLAVTAGRPELGAGEPTHRPHAEHRSVDHVHALDPAARGVAVEVPLEALDVRELRQPGAGTSLRAAPGSARRWAS